MGDLQYHCLWITKCHIRWQPCIVTEVQSTILIQHTFCHIQVIASHGHLAFRSVCALKKTTTTLVCTQSWLCKTGNKHSVSERDVNNSSQSTHCFRSTEGRGGSWLAVELKYQQTFTRIVDLWLDVTKLWPPNKLYMYIDFTIYSTTDCPSSFQVKQGGGPVFITKFCF